MKNEIIYIICTLSIFGSMTGSWLISKYGHQLKLLDKPNDRSSHNSITPKGGGVGILTVFIFASLTLKIAATFWITAAILSFISLLGDRIEIPVIIRLFFQFTASTIFLVGLLENYSYLGINYLLIIPLILFIVGTANYYNFMDGINGIAGISGAVGFGLLAVYAHIRSMDANLMVLCIALGLSCLGFLPYNIPNARVFMGDVGSILLGFAYAAIVVWFSKNILDFICLAYLLFPFYADEITTELARLKDGQKLWTPHRQHLYQILANEYHISHWKVSIGYGILQLCVGASSLCLLRSGLVTVSAIFALYFFTFFMISTRLRRRLVPGSDK